jgi:hypothetical protein
MLRHSWEESSSAALTNLAADCRRAFELFENENGVLYSIFCAAV